MKAIFCGTPGVQKKLALKRLRDAALRLFPNDRIFTWKPLGAPPVVPVIEDLLYPTGSPIAFLKQAQRSQQDRCPYAVRTP